MDCIQYNETYNKCNESSLDELLNNYSKAHILSDLVQEIKEGIEEEKEIIFMRQNIKKASDDILDDYYVSIAEDELTSVDFDIKELDIYEEGYNNHVYEKNRYK